MTRARDLPESDDPLVVLLPIVRRVVSARVRDPHTVDDLVQETLARVMAARSRIEQDTLVPYAVVTARNLVYALGRGDERERTKAHLLVEDDYETPPDETLLRQEETGDVGTALKRLSPVEREVLLAHEVEGTPTAALAARAGGTPGAIAAQLNRTRAKLRVEYLLTQGRAEPPSDRCRPVLFALSGGDRRRQRELDSAGHLLECEFCAELSSELFERRPRAAETDPDDERVPVAVDADVVTARQKGREVAARAGFGSTDLTVVATAISEVARNIVKFAVRGEVLIRVLDEGGRKGVRIVARDAGPGIPDLAAAMRDGVSTYQGLGLGLPGARRLMDEFDVATEVGKGTTVTMTKWR